MSDYEYNRGGYDYRRERDSYRGYERGGREGGSRGPEVNAGACYPPTEADLFRVADQIDPTEIDYSFYDLPVKLHTGGNPDVKPLDNIEELLDYLPDQVSLNIKRMKYEQPTPIEKYSLPIIEQHHDLLATSETGSGKSAAFLLPIFKEIISGHLKDITKSPYSPMDRNFAHSRYGGRSSPFAVILSPTRELALQNFTAAWQFSFKTNVITRVCYGGEGMGEESQALREGGDIIIATPGRLKAFIENGLVDLSYVRTFVLDEADTMIDMGFIDDIKTIRSSIVEAKRIAMSSSIEGVTDNLETLLFSATFPKEIEEIADQFLKNFYHLEIGKEGVTGTNIDQLLLHPSLIAKFSYLKAILERPGKVLIFCNEKVEVQQLTENIKREIETGTITNIPEDIVSEVGALFANEAQTESETRSTTTVLPELKSVRSVECLHGDNTQRQRITALDNFKTGKLKALVCTDVAERGLDLPKVEYVVNYDFPKTIEDYSHRIGRTGRAGHRGTAITFVSNSDSSGILRELKNKLTESKQVIPEWFAEMSISRGRSAPGNRYGGYNGGGRGYQQRPRYDNYERRDYQRDDYEGRSEYPRDNYSRDEW